MPWRGGTVTGRGGSPILATTAWYRGSDASDA
jgi:hypothetical protein